MKASASPRRRRSAGLAAALALAVSLAGWSPCPARAWEEDAQKAPGTALEALSASDESEAGEGEKEALTGQETAQEGAQEGFSDVSADHWAAPSIAAMVAQGIMQGVGDGRFEPDRPISAAEFLVMLVRELCPEKLDMSLEGAWYVPYLYAGAGLLDRTSYTGVFEDPAMLEGDLDRYDMAGMTAQALDGVVYGDVTAIADWESVPDRYKDAVAVGWGMGLLRGVDEQGTFNGLGVMTRAQAAVVMERLIPISRAQREAAPAPAGAVAIDRANAQIEAVDTPEGFYIYSFPDGGENANHLGRITLDNPGYTRLRVTMRTGATEYGSHHTFRVFDQSGTERALLFYIYQASDTQRTYEVDITGVSRLELSMCYTCYCEAVLSELCLY